MSDPKNAPEHDEQGKSKPTLEIEETSRLSSMVDPGFAESSQVKAAQLPVAPTQTPVHAGPSPKDKSILSASIAAQLLGILLIYKDSSSSSLVVFWEGAAITVASFLMGFATTVNARFWRWFFGGANLLVVLVSWYLINHH